MTAEAEYIAAGNLIAAANAGWGNPVGDFGYPFVTASLVLTMVQIMIVAT